MFKHGVYVNEKKVATQKGPEAVIPVVFGTAPIGPVNTPVLVRSRSAAVESFGFSEDFDSFTLSEFTDCFYNLYGQSTAIFVNVMDPATAKKSNSVPLEVSQVDTVTNIQYPILDSVKIKKGSTSLVKDTDFVAILDKDGFLVITIPQGSSVTLPATDLALTYDAVDPSKVKNSDLMGSSNSTTGARTGFELLDTVVPLFGVVPGLVLAPKYSTNASIADAMISKSQQINGMFKAFALTDIDTSTVKTKQAAITTKKTGDPGQYIGWPKVSFEGKQYHLSTHMAGVIAKMDAENNGVPSNSPSNKTMKVDGCVLADGTPISIGIDDANDLNGAGISTMLSFIGGPRAWGNRTAAYPEETDMKDVFIVAKRMMFWINNWIITDTWNDVDSNITKRFVEAVTSKHNMRLNGLTSAGAILGGKCIFNPDENQAGQLIDGKIKFGLSVGFAGVAENIEFSIEIDPSYLEGISL